MTIVTLQVPEEIEQKLQARAKEQGQDVPAVVLELIERELKNQSNGKQVERLSHEEWLREFHEWVESHPKVDVVLDCSRESIYEGRGE